MAMKRARKTKTLNFNTQLSLQGLAEKLAQEAVRIHESKRLTSFKDCPSKKPPRVKAEIPVKSEIITVNTLGGLDVNGQIFTGDKDGKEDISLPIPIPGF